MDVALATNFPRGRRVLRPVPAYGALGAADFGGDLRGVQARVKPVPVGHSGGRSQRDRNLPANPVIGRIRFLTKYPAPLIRRGSYPCGGVVEVETARAVEGFFGAAGGQSVGQDGVLVAVAAGEVDGEAPDAGRAAVT